MLGFGAGGNTYNAPIIDSVPGFKIKKILTGNPKNIQQAKKDFPLAEIVQDFEKLIQDPEIELLIITLPNHLHFEFAEKALKAGKHVVLEKPFAPSVPEAEKLIQLAKKQKKYISVHHNRRWDSDFRTIQKLLQENILGEIVEYEAHFDRFRSEIKENWKEDSALPGSGILYDLGSHLIDQALVLFGNPTEVFAHLRMQRENSEVIDNFELLLLYPRLKVSLKAGMLVRYPNPKFQISGRKASFIKSGMDVQEAALKRGEKPKNFPDWGKENPANHGNLISEKEDFPVISESGDYREFYKNIYQVLLGNENLKVTGEQAKTVIKIIELAQKSHSDKHILPFS